jgi:hypothetical protein
MKRGLFIIGIVFAITLAIVFATRISADALAVIVGVILGIGAGIPTTLLAILIMTRRQGPDRNLPPASLQPPVVIVNTPDRAALSPPPALPAPYSSDLARKWTVIGDSETES